MDFLNQATAQVRDLLLSMTPAARITAVLLSGVIAVSLGYLVKQQSASPDDYLFNGEFLPGSDVDAAEAAIAQAGLKGYERVGNRIRVPRGSKSEYLAAVADAGALPPNFDTLMDKALDQSPFTDSSTRKQRYKSAREQQLSRIVRAMHGIEDAQVIYDILKPQGLSRAAVATATVSVQPSPGETLDPIRAKRIKQLVAGAIAQLSPSNVTVTNLGNGSMYGADGGGISADSFDDPYFQKKINYERLMKANIQDLLANIPGATVQVTAELDIVAERTTRITEPSGEAVARRESTQKDDQETSEQDNGGRPGLVAQGPGRNKDQAPEVVVKKKSTIENTDTDNFIPLKDEFFRETGMTPQSVRVAIAIPSNYLLSVWRERERKKGADISQPLPDNIQTELDSLRKAISTQIQGAVVPLLPKELAENKFSDVVVTFFESLTPKEVEAPSAAGQFMSWASQNFSTMTMAGIAMFSLVMLRSMVKSIPPSEPVTSINPATLAFDPSISEQAPVGTTEATENEEGHSRLTLNRSGPNLKEDLTDIVREDPDAAAAILRNWIGNAG